MVGVFTTQNTGRAVSEAWMHDCLGLSESLSTPFAPHPDTNHLLRTGKTLLFPSI